MCPALTETYGILKPRAVPKDAPTVPIAIRTTSATAPKFVASITNGAATRPNAYLARLHHDQFAGEEQLGTLTESAVSRIDHLLPVPVAITGITTDSNAFPRELLVRGAIAGITIDNNVSRKSLTVPAAIAGITEENFVFLIDLTHPIAVEENIGITENKSASPTDLTHLPVVQDANGTAGNKSASITIVQGPPDLTAAEANAGTHAKINV